MAAIVSSARPGRTGRSTSAASTGTAANVRVRPDTCRKATENLARTRPQTAMKSPTLRGRPKRMTTAHRISNLAGVVVPFIGLIAAIVLLWNTLVDWSDLAVLAFMYVICGFAVTVGFHRLLTHRSFQTYMPVQYLYGVLGSMAVQ